MHYPDSNQGYTFILAHQYGQKKLKEIENLMSNATLTKTAEPKRIPEDTIIKGVDVFGRRPKDPGKECTLQEFRTITPQQHEMSIRAQRALGWIS